MLRIVANEAKNHCAAATGGAGVTSGTARGSWPHRARSGSRRARCRRRAQAWRWRSVASERERSTGARLPVLRRVVGSRNGERRRGPGRHGQVEDCARTGQAAHRNGATMIDLERSLGELADRLEIPGDEWLVDDVLRRIGEPPRAGSCAAESRGWLARSSSQPSFVADRRRCPARAMRLPVGWVSTACASNPASRCRRTTSTTILVDCGPRRSRSTTPACELWAGRRVDRAKRCRDRPARSDARRCSGTPQSIHVVQPPRGGQIVAGLSAVGTGPGVPCDRCRRARVGDAGAHRRGLLPEDPRHRGDGAPRRLRRRRRILDRGIAASVDVRDRQDQIQQDTLRLATNTLLWQRNGHVYRIEADISISRPPSRSPSRCP